VEFSYKQAAICMFGRAAVEASACQCGVDCVQRCGGTAAEGHVQSWQRRCCGRQRLPRRDERGRRGAVTSPASALVVHGSDLLDDGHVPATNRRRDDQHRHVLRGLRARHAVQGRNCMFTVLRLLLPICDQLHGLATISLIVRH